MKTVLLRGVGGKTVIAAQLARSTFQRARGLLFSDAPPLGHGLLIPHCSTVHTIGMRFPIDVVFLDLDLTVTEVYESARPGRIAVRGRSAVHTLELVAGHAKLLDISASMKFTIEQARGSTVPRRRNGDRS